VFWHTGRIDFLTFTLEADALFRLLGIGWVVTIVAGLFFGLRSRWRNR
jgi:hypothetical protein